MIEYTIKVASLLLDKGIIDIQVIPQNESLASTIPKRIHIPEERFTYLMSITPDEVLVELRNDIMRLNRFFQKTWSQELSAKNSVVSPELLAAEGQIFPVVTQEEIDAFMPAEVVPVILDPEVII
jgi:hypothetical protein